MNKINFVQKTLCKMNMFISMEDLLGPSFTFCSTEPYDQYFLQIYVSFHLFWTFTNYPVLTILREKKLIICKNIYNFSAIFEPMHGRRLDPLKS